MQVSIQQKKEEMTDLLKQIIEQYNENVKIQTQLREQINEVQGAIKVLKELEQIENGDQNTNTETAESS